MQKNFPFLTLKQRVSSGSHVVPKSGYERRRRILEFISRIRSLRRVRALIPTPQPADWTTAMLADLGLTLEQAHVAAEAACKRIGVSFSRPYSSVHMTLFAAIAASGFRAANILEVGTGSGQTTRFLADLFPEAKIHTIELPADDPIYGPNAGGFDQGRLAQFLDLPQITAHHSNSAFLNELNLPDFDLIWLDGGHVFPEVAWDHFYCLAKLRKGGWLLSDDIRLPGNPLYDRYEGSTDAYETLRYYAERTGHDFYLAIKRTDLQRNLFDPKYVGAIKKG